MLARRLVDIARDLLHQNQVAFIKGRLVVDNIHLAQELLRSYTNRMISPRCIMKINLQKTYDLVHLDFIKEMLQGFGFPHQCVS